MRGARQSDTNGEELDLEAIRAPLIAKFGRLIDLTDRECQYLREMQAEFIRARDGQDIVIAGHAYNCIFILNRGMAIRYKVLHNGRRQVLNLVLPGDLIGFPGCLFDYSLYSIASLGEAVACSVPHHQVVALFKDQPRLGAALFWLIGHETTLYTEHLVGVGQQSAYERVSHLLLELLVRLQAVGLADERSYALPITQDMMADALGMSQGHVNRTLRRLREDGLVTLDGVRVILPDVDALSRVADFNRVTLRKRQIPGL